MNVDINFVDKELQLFCFIGRHPNMEVDTLPGRRGLMGIYRNEFPGLIRSLRGKKVIACYEHKKDDFANAWKYQARGQVMPQKTIQTCTLSRLGTIVHKNKC